MKNHLKSAVDRYNKSKRGRAALINPISEMDAEIIVEIIEALKKVDRRDLVAILDLWKYNKDESVRDALLQWNIDFKNNPSNEDESKDEFYIKPREFIKFNDEPFELYYIFHYDRIDGWDEDECEPKYGIILNKIPSELNKIPRYANRIIYFYDYDERETNFRLLEEYFAGQDDIVIL